MAFSLHQFCLNNYKSDPIEVGDVLYIESFSGNGESNGFGIITVQTVTPSPTAVYITGTSPYGSEYCQSEVMIGTTNYPKDIAIKLWSKNA